MHIPTLPTILVMILAALGVIAVGVVHILRRTYRNHEMATGVAYAATALPVLGFGIVTASNKHVPTVVLGISAGVFTLLLLIMGGIALRNLGKQDAGFAVANTVLVILLSDMAARSASYALRSHPDGAVVFHYITVGFDVVVSILLLLVVIGFISDGIDAYKKRRATRIARQAANRQPSA